MKNLVKTTGDFMLVDPASGDHMASDRPYVATATHFVAMRVALGQIKILSNEIPQELGDSDFLKFFEGSDKDEELAVQSFLASFGPEAVQEPVPKVAAPEPKVVVSKKAEEEKPPVVEPKAKA